MNRILRLTQSLGLNTIPVVGVFWREWSDTTAVAFYWSETALVVLFVSLRLILHKRLTKKRGHYVESRMRVNGGPEKTTISTFNRTFLMTAIAFGLGNLVFLAVLLGLFGDRIGGGPLDTHALRNALLVATVFVALCFIIDLPRLAKQPFLFARRMAEGALRRVFVLYTAIFIGLICAMLLNVPRGLFATFFALKLFTDITSGFKEYDPESPPWWLFKLNKDPAFQETFRAERAERKQAEAEDEDLFDGRPSQTTAFQKTKAAGTSSASRRRMPS